MNYNKDFLSVLYFHKQDNNEFKFNNSKLTKWKNRKNENNAKLFEFINTKVPYKLRNELKNLIVDYSEAQSAYFGIENELFYRKGFKDGNCLKETLRNI